jgi:hypothetical protein
MKKINSKYISEKEKIKINKKKLKFLNKKHQGKLCKKNKTTIYIL